MMLSERLQYKRQGSGHHKEENGKFRKIKSVQPKPPCMPMSTEFGVGEDETSHRNNVRYLKQVCFQRGSDGAVESLMKRTFVKRRYDVLNKVESALNVIEEYPPLQTSSGVSL